jgi:hypothetical protein
MFRFSCRSLSSMSLRRWSVALVVLAHVAGSVGCRSGDGRARYAVDGEVTLDGQPLAEGTVVFYPTTGDHDADTASIVNGKFSVMTTEGTKRVEIDASTLSDKTEPSAIDGKPVRVRISLIPPRYNHESTLTATVDPRPQNRVRFELSSDS